MSDDEYDVQLPASVRANAEKADKLAQQMFEGGQEGERQATSQGEEGMQDAPQAPSNPEPPQETPPQNQPTADGPKVLVVGGQQLVGLNDYNALMQKFRSLDGKINAENPRLKKRVEQLNGIIDNLTQKVDAAGADKKDLESKLQEALSNRRDPDTGGGQPGEGEIDPDEFERYGPEFQKLANRVNTQAAQMNKLIEINQKQADIIEQLGAGKSPVRQEAARSTGDQTRDSRINFYVEDIQGFVTDAGYKDVNAEQLGSDPAFNAWLDNTVDEQFGLTMRTIMKGHNAQFNADGASKVILKYLKSTTDTAATTRTPPVEPGKPLPAGTETGVQAKVWTSADINRFYRDWREGRIPDDQARATEREILSATQGAAVRR